MYLITDSQIKFNNICVYLYALNSWGLAAHAVWKEENMHIEEIYWKEPIYETENEMDTQY